MITTWSWRNALGYKFISFSGWVTLKKKQWYVRVCDLSPRKYPDWRPKWPHRRMKLKSNWCLKNLHVQHSLLHFLIASSSSTYSSMVTIHVYWLTMYFVTQVFVFFRLQANYISRAEYYRLKFYSGILSLKRWNDNIRICILMFIPPFWNVSSWWRHVILAILRLLVEKQEYYSANP